jgi:hypothetical protein
MFLTAISNEMRLSAELKLSLYIVIASCQSYETMKSDVMSWFMIDSSLLQCTNLAPVCRQSRFVGNGGNILTCFVSYVCDHSNCFWDPCGPVSFTAVLNVGPCSPSPLKEGEWIPGQTLRKAAKETVVQRHDHSLEYYFLVNHWEDNCYTKPGN